MTNLSTKLSFRMFADDANIFYACKDPRELELVMNNELNHVLKYCHINKLSVNKKKTNYMLITSPRKKYIQMNILNIERKSYIRYLGIYLVNTLTGKVKLLMLIIKQQNI